MAILPGVDRKFAEETEGGVADLLGNVWEWIQNRRGQYVVLKGGAWDSMDLLRQGLQAERLELDKVRQDNIGFRVMVEG